MSSTILHQPANNFNTDVKRAELLRILAAAGARFTLMPYRSKNPGVQGWPHIAHTLDEAMTHAGNVGLLCGDYSAGIGAIDADADTDAYPATWPKLRNAIKVWRADAPHKGKWIVRCAGYVGGVDKPADIDRLFNNSNGGGMNAVIAGVHVDGAPIQWTGTEIPELTADEIDAIHAWRRERAGLPADATSKPRTERTDHKPRTQQGTDAVDTVKRTWSTLDVFRHHGLAGNAETYRDGRTELHGNGGLYIEADNARWYCFSGDVGGDNLDAWSWCTTGQRIDRNDPHAFIDIVRQMAEAAGIPFDSTNISEAERASARDILAAARVALTDADFAAIVPAELHAENGYRTRDTDATIADHALGILQQRGTLEGQISLLSLYERTGLRRATCKAALHRLQRILTPVSDAGNGKATVYQVNLDELRRLTGIHTSSKATCQSTQLPIATHAGHDAFSRRVTPITPEQLDERMIAREEKRLDAIWHNKHELATGVPQELIDVPKPLDPNRYRRRLAADLPSAGRAVLMAINAITVHGALTRGELGAILHKKKSGVSRLIKQGLELGLLVVDDGTVDIAPHWAELADAFAPYMPTAGDQKRRQIEAADSRIEYCDAALRNGNLAEKERKSLNRRLERAAKRKFELAKDEAPDLPHRNADTPSMSLWDWLKAAAAMERHAEARFQMAEQRHADEWRLVAEIQAMRRDGVTRQDAVRMLEFTDWQRTEIWSAMATAWPQAVAA